MKPRTSPNINKAKKKPKTTRQTVIETFDTVIEEVIETKAYEAPQTIEDDPFNDVDIPLSDTDPDSDEIPAIRAATRKQVAKMVPQMYEKFINAPAKDAATIFEAMADRAEFTKPSTSNSGNVNILNLNPSDMLPLLEGIKKITGDSND